MKSLMISKQSRRPSGLLGRVVAHGMARDTAACNDRAVECLDIQPTDRILEIGYGHGRTVHRMAARATEGFVAGVDFSATMHAIATRKNRRLIDAGRVYLVLADSAVLPYGDAEFHKVLTVHTIYFWTDPAQHVREIARVLRPGGRLVLGFRPNDGGTLEHELPAAVYRLYAVDAVRDLLCGAGLSVTAVETSQKGNKRYAYAIAEK